MPRISLYGFYKYDPSLLDSIRVPETMNKQFTIDAIMERCGDMFPVHQDGDFLKHHIHSWFERNRTQFDKMFAAFRAEYSAIENYDRYEDTTDNGTATGKSRSTSEVSAFNVSDFSPTSAGDADTTSTSGNVHVSHIHGNIGVMTAADMINKEMVLREIDLYNEVARLFEKHFMIGVY